MELSIKKINLMNVQDKLKHFLKNISLVYGANTFYKALCIKRKYKLLKSFYEKEAIRQGLRYQENSIPTLVRDNFKKRGLHIENLPKGQLRIFWVGANYAQDSGGIIQALEKFGEVISFQGRPGIYGQIWPVGSDVKIARKDNSKNIVVQVSESLKSKPVHILIGQMWNMTVTPNALNKIRKMGLIVVNISMDDRHVFKHRKLHGDWTGPYGLIGALDLSCTAAKECCLWYLVEGCPAIYLPEASDPDFYSPIPGPKLYDVSFVGGNYGIRAKIVKALRKAGVNVTVYGQGWPNGMLATERIPELFAYSKIVLGVGTIRTTKDFYALKMRDFDGPMSGSLYLTHHNPDLEELFDVGKEIETYHTIKECVQKVLYYLNHPLEAERIGKAGRLRAEKEHTWEHRFGKLFRTLGLIQ